MFVESKSEQRVSEMQGLVDTIQSQRKLIETKEAEIERLSGLVNKGNTQLKKLSDNNKKLDMQVHSSSEKKKDDGNLESLSEKEKVKKNVENLQESLNSLRLDLQSKKLEITRLQSEAKSHKQLKKALEECEVVGNKKSEKIEKIMTINENLGATIQNLKDRLSKAEEGSSPDILDKQREIIEQQKRTIDELNIRVETHKTVASSFMENIIERDCEETDPIHQESGQKHAEQLTQLLGVSNCIWSLILRYNQNNKKNRVNKKILLLRS